MITAHHHGIGLARQADIVGIAPFAAQQHRVFGAWHWLADGEPVVEPECARVDVVVHGWLTSFTMGTLLPITVRASAISSVEDIQQNSGTEIAEEAIAIGPGARSRGALDEARAANAARNRTAPGGHREWWGLLLYPVTSGRP